MPTIDATVGGANANSYVDVTFAAAYFDDRLHSSVWSNASNDDRDRSLIMATREIDTRIAWDGYKVTETQALDWPRSGLYDDNRDYVDEDTLPIELKNAVCEYALVLLGTDTLAPQETGLESLVVDVIELKFKTSDRLQPIPPNVFGPLSKWGSIIGNQPRMVRG